MSIFLDCLTIRNKRMHAAYAKYGYALKEVADHLEIHYTMVSMAIKGLKEK